MKPVEIVRKYLEMFEEILNISNKIFEKFWKVKCDE